MRLITQAAFEERLKAGGFYIRVDDQSWRHPKLDAVASVEALRDINMWYPTLREPVLERDAAFFQPSATAAPVASERFTLQPSGLRRGRRDGRGGFAARVNDRRRLLCGSHSAESGGKCHCHHRQECLNDSSSHL